MTLMNLKLDFLFTDLSQHKVKLSCVKKLKVIQPPEAYAEAFRHLPLYRWAPKLGAKIKGELMQSNISHLIISSTHICQHVLRHLI